MKRAAVGVAALGIALSIWNWMRRARHDGHFIHRNDSLEGESEPDAFLQQLKDKKHRQYARQEPQQSPTDEVVTPKRSQEGKRLPTSSASVSSSRSNSSRRGKRFESDFESDESPEHKREDSKIFFDLYALYAEVGTDEGIPIEGITSEDYDQVSELDDRLSSRRHSRGYSQTSRRQTFPTQTTELPPRHNAARTRSQSSMEYSSDGGGSRNRSTTWTRARSNNQHLRRRTVQLESKGASDREWTPSSDEESVSSISSAPATTHRSVGPHQPRFTGRDKYKKKRTPVRHDTRRVRTSRRSKTSYHPDDNTDHHSPSSQQYSNLYSWYHSQTAHLSPKH